MDQKLRLCILLEGTAATQPVWSSLRLQYVEPLLRSLEQGPATGHHELSLVLFQCGLPYSRCSLETGGWTSDIAEFRQWLDKARLDGGGCQETPLSEALAEAMYLFQRPSQQGEAVAFQRQCVVVAQSEPTRLLMPWAALENTQGGTQLVSCEELAQQLPQNGIHLSVIMQNTRSGARNRLMHLFSLAAQAESKEANGGHISKELLRTSFVTLTQGSFILVSPKWGAAKALLEAERALLHTSQGPLAESPFAGTPQVDSPAAMAAHYGATNPMQADSPSTAAQSPPVFNAYPNLPSPQGALPGPLLLPAEQRPPLQHPAQSSFPPTSAPPQQQQQQHNAGHAVYAQNPPPTLQQQQNAVHLSYPQSSLSTLQQQYAAAAPRNAHAAPAAPHQQQQQYQPYGAGHSGYMQGMPAPMQQPHAPARPGVWPAVATAVAPHQDRQPSYMQPAAPAAEPQPPAALQPAYLQAAAPAQQQQQQAPYGSAPGRSGGAEPQQYQGGYQPQLGQLGQLQQHGLGASQGGPGSNPGAPIPAAIAAQQKAMQTVWRGEVILTGSAIRQAAPLRLCVAHAVVGQAFSLDTSRWGPALVIEKLIDYRTPAVSELTKRHNGGIQGRLIQRPESITPQSADVLQKMTDAHLGGFLKLGGYEMIFIATPGRPTDRGQLRLGFVLFPAP